MDILAQLRAIPMEDDFVYHCYPLTEAWRTASVGAESVEPILRFMEENPDRDLGTPGPLVHFVELFYDSGDYTAKLVASVHRKPVSYTVWMLNRILNVTDDQNERDRLLAVMRGVLSNPNANEQLRDEATDFLGFQAGQG